jgi:hypothetical protein
METRGVRTARQADGSRLDMTPAGCELAQWPDDATMGAMAHGRPADTTPHASRTWALASEDASGVVRTNTSAGSGAVSVLPQHNVMKGDAYPLHAR